MQQQKIGKLSKNDILKEIQCATLFPYQILKANMIERKKE